MEKIDRRKFLGSSVLGAIGVATIGCAEESQATNDNDEGHADSSAAVGASFDRPISFQSYGMRKEIEQDFPGTLKAVKDLGYDGFEMCSPIGYVKSGFGNLTPLPPAEIKQQIEDSGLFCKTSHFVARELIEDDPAQTADYAAAMGLSDIIMSGSGIGNDGTVDDFKRWGEKCNKAGEVVKAAGLRLGYHNHQVLPVLDGRTQYDVIMDSLDPDLITMQFQFASIRGGVDIEHYLKKYAGRFSSLHMHDYNPTGKARQEGRRGEIVPLGEGIVDWSACLKAAMQSDIADHGFIIEIETDQPLDGLKRSIKYLKSVKV